MSYIREGQHLQLKALEVFLFPTPVLEVWREEMRAERDLLRAEIEQHPGYPILCPDGPRYLLGVINGVIAVINGELLQRGEK